MYLKQIILVFILAACCGFIRSQSLVFSTANHEFFLLDPERCEYELLFKVQFPSHFNEVESFVSGFTFTPDGDLLGVNGYHLFEIDQENGSVILIDSIEVSTRGDPKWLSITAGPDGLIYLGTTGLYIYDLVTRSIISRPKWENSWVHYYGGDMAWHPHGLLNYNQFLQTIEVLDPISESEILSARMPGYGNVFSLAYLSTQCDEGLVYGFRYHKDSSWLFKTEFGEEYIDTICLILEPYCSGLSSYYELKNDYVVLDAELLIEEEYSGYKIDWEAPCDQSRLQPLGLDISGCGFVDSIKLISSSIKIMDELISAKSRDTFLWVNSYSWTLDQIEAWLVELQFQFIDEKPNSKVDVLFFQNKNSSLLSLNIQRDLVYCRDLVFNSSYFPNAFTPDGDGINDTYQVFLGKNITLMDFEVYSRAGQLVYVRSMEKQVEWDGSQLQPGVYIYNARIRNASTGTIETRTGSITLLK